MEDSGIQQRIYRQVEQLELELDHKDKQLNCMMSIAQAINMEKSSDDLFNMYASFLADELEVGKMALFFKSDEEWICEQSINFNVAHQSHVLKHIIGKYPESTPLGEKVDPSLKGFDIVIPVLFQEEPIAYTLIGRLPKNHLYEVSKFIITITNIVAVAIENKRLFHERLNREKYKKELELAQQVQAMLIPSKLPKEKMYELSAIYRPHSSIGGDYFDYFQKPDGSFVVCIADISGKGIPAALLMANFQATLRGALEEYKSLDQVIQKINRAVIAVTNSEKIITFFIMEYHPELQRLQYVNAGHNPPIHLSGNTIQKLRDGCTLLGAVDEIEDITIGELMIEEDTTLLIYTDGLTDLTNDNGQYFDDAALSRFLMKKKRETAENFNNELLQELKSFKGKQKFPDDIAILTCKLKPSRRVRRTKSKVRDEVLLT